jgi:hypothetical protein
VTISKQLIAGTVAAASAVAQNTNGALNASQFAGSDAGAKINAAVASLAGSPGKITLDPTVGTYTVTTPIVLPRNVVLDCQKATLTASSNLPVNAVLGISILLQMNSYSASSGGPWATGGPQNCILQGYNNTGVGVFFGDTTQASSTNYGSFQAAYNEDVSGFQYGVMFGTNSWFDTIQGGAIHQNTYGISTMVGGGNTGEEFKINDVGIYGNTCGFYGNDWSLKFIVNGGSIDYNGAAGCGSAISIELNGSWEEQEFGPFFAMTGTGYSDVKRIGGTIVLVANTYTAQSSVATSSGLVTLASSASDAFSYYAAGRSVSISGCTSTWGVSHLNGITAPITSVSGVGAANGSIVIQLSGYSGSADTESAETCSVAPVDQAWDSFTTNVAYVTNLAPTLYTQHPLNYWVSSSGFVHLCNTGLTWWKGSAPSDNFNNSGDGCQGDTMFAGKVDFNNDISFNGAHSILLYTNSLYSGGVISTASASGFQAAPLGNAVSGTNYGSAPVQLISSIWHSTSAPVTDYCYLSSIPQSGTDPQVNIALACTGGSAGLHIFNPQIPTYSSNLISGLGLVSPWAIAATSGANQPSSSLKLTDSFWNGTSSANDTYMLIATPGTGTNPDTTLALTGAGSTGKHTFDLSNLSAVVLPGTVRFSGTTPTVSAGTPTGTNEVGRITGLSAAATVTITFANSGWTTWAACPSLTTSTGTQAYPSATSTTAVTVTFASAFTGTLYYGCGGN